MAFYLNLRCDGCREQVMHPDTGSTYTAPVESYIHQDLQGSLPSTITPPMGKSACCYALKADGGAEALLITDVLSRMAPVFPPTYWPVPYLHRRVAMLIVTNPESTVPELIAAVQHLGQALDAIDEWHGYKGCPQMLYLWVIKTAAHEKARIKLTRQTPQDVDAIEGQRRERDEAVEQARAELMALYGERCFVGWMGRLVESWMGLS
ncbi:hypothetical protein BCR39DRAFT_541182 [Naematelia encephala]|uniref:Uncharacterized protein n=1 Tax=Naematelia encephala TaxID=71784 RepID=A0A1Y2AWL6_9TREE|nr:hypothetical protein BCR39DRAFT_541182 [Naematelia encephala]